MWCIALEVSWNIFCKKTESQLMICGVQWAVSNWQLPSVPELIFHCMHWATLKTVECNCCDVHTIINCLDFHVIKNFIILCEEIRWLFIYLIMWTLYNSGDLIQLTYSHYVPTPSNYFLQFLRRPLPLFNLHNSHPYFHFIRGAVMNRSQITVWCRL